MAVGVALATAGEVGAVGDTTERRFETSCLAFPMEASVAAEGITTAVEVTPRWEVAGVRMRALVRRELTRVVHGVRAIRMPRTVPAMVVWDRRLTSARPVVP